MYSSNVSAGTAATKQQYNNLRQDAKGGSYLNAHEASTPNMTVIVENGYFYDSSSTKVTCAGGTVTIGAVGTYPRWDLISVNGSGTLVTTVGIAGASPVKPTLPTGNFPVCYVYVRVGGTSVKTDDDTINHYIEDIRMIALLPTSADMVLSGTQTVSGLKTFLSGMFGLRNVANTFTSFFTNTNTASRTYTLQNRNGTLADDTDLALKANLASPTFTGTVSGITKSMVGLANVDNTSDVNKPVSTAQQTALDLKANLASPTFTGTVSGITKSMVGLGNVDNTSDVNKPVSTAQAAADTTVLNTAKSYADGLVVGLLDDRGNYDASGNVFPSTGGSGTAGAILKGDLWYISVAGTLGGTSVAIGSSIRALTDTPGQTAGNWDILSVGLGYVPENVANKSTSVTTDQASNTKYPSVKSVYDWAVGLFATITGTQTLTNKTIVTPIIASIKGVVITDTDGTTITFDKNIGEFHRVVLGGNRVLSLSNMAPGDRIVIDLVQDATGNRTVTWFTTIKWAGGAPTLSTGANKIDTFGFLCTSAGNYQGYTIGQNL